MECRSLLFHTSYHSSIQLQYGLALNSPAQSYAKHSVNYNSIFLFRKICEHRNAQPFCNLLLRPAFLLIDASCPTNNASAQNHISFNIRAAAICLPPLFPLPHTTSVSEKLLLCHKTLTVSSAALSINTSDGTPYFFNRICICPFICAPLEDISLISPPLLCCFNKRPQFPAAVLRLQVSIIFSVRLLADWI